MGAKTGERLLALGVALAALLVYLRTLAPTVLPADSGEFQFAAPLLGLVHPTGYPLYLLLGKLWTLLMPVGDIAYRMNLLSAVCSAAAVGALFLLCRRLGLAPASSAAAALLFAVSRTFWSQAVRAEVYALNSLFVVLLLLLACDNGLSSAPTIARRYLLPFVFGLALTHHRMVILLIPALIVLAWPLAHQSDIRNRQSAIQNLKSRIGPVLTLLAPLLLYLLIPLRAAAAPYLRLAVAGGPDLVLYQNTLSDFAGLVMGNVFRGSLGAFGAATLLDRAAMAARLLWQDMGPVALLAVPGILALKRRQPRLAAGLALAYAAVLAFCLVYFIGDVAELFTPSYIVLAVLAAAGLDLVQRAGERLRARLGRALVLGLAAVLAGLLLQSNLAGNDLSGQRQTRAAWQALLSRPLPQGAVLVSNDRDEMTPMWYLQYVEHVRPDLVGLFPQIKQGQEFAKLGALLDWLLARGVQPYLIKPMPGLEIKYRLQSDGALPQVAGYAASASVQPQRPVHAGLDGRVELLGADVGGTPAAGGMLSVALYWRTLATMVDNYHVFVQLTTAGGERVQGSDHRPGGDFYATAAWAPGDVLVDRHDLSLPAGLPAGVYRIKAGMYRYPSLARLAVSGSQETTIDLGTVQIR